MATTPLALFKSFVNADDYADDDTLLQHLLDTAESHIVRSTRRTAAELTELGGGSFPAELQQAAMALASHWYNQRESVSGVQMHQVPETVDALVKPFRKLSEE